MSECRDERSNTAANDGRLVGDDVRDYERVGCIAHRRWRAPVIPRSQLLPTSCGCSRSFAAGLADVTGGGTQCGRERPSTSTPVGVCLSPAIRRIGFEMTAESGRYRDSTLDAEDAARGLVALSKISLDHGDAAQVLQAAADAVATLAPCQVEASYRVANDALIRCPASQPDRPDFDRLIGKHGCDRSVTVGDGRWAWAFSLRHQSVVHGCLVVSAAHQPTKIQFLLLTLFAWQTGAGLAHAAMHDRDATTAQQLETTVLQLQRHTEQLQRQIDMREVLRAALSAGLGEHGIADALYGITAIPVALEDQFGNLRCWSGPGCPDPYPKQTADRRERLLHKLATYSGPLRIRDRVFLLVKPRAEILGVLALLDPDKQATDDDVFALQAAATAMALELSHQRHVAEVELTVRRELFDDLLSGTDAEGAYARAAALGHDLRRAHYTVVIQAAGRADTAVAAAAAGAATAQGLKYLQGRRSGLIVLLVGGRPKPAALHVAVSEQLGRTPTAIGIGSRCDTPAGFPQSFTEARRALKIRLRSAAPDGATAFDELGFYRLIDAAHSRGTVQDYVHEWLGDLIDYDERKCYALVQTLSTYLETGGSYDDAAAAMHIHRSTLRYRLARIRQLTGLNIRDVDTRFNLQTATRAWRFLNPDD
ncbi:MAG: hypothetical protein JWR32_4196 [Mycobacterium sp.]|nr:hypothetical protein [Mycobacterium sp.]